MRELSDIFRAKQGQVKREILFEDGKWCMYKRSLEGCVRDARKTFIVHRCAKSRFAIYVENGGDRKTEWVCGSGDTGEGGCGAETPEAMKGMWCLYEWERLC